MAVLDEHTISYLRSPCNLPDDVSQTSHYGYRKLCEADNFSIPMDETIRLEDTAGKAPIFMQDQVRFHAWQGVVSCQGVRGGLVAGRLVFPEIPWMRTKVGQQASQVILSYRDEISVHESKKLW